MSRVQLGLNGEVFDLNLSNGKGRQVSWNMLNDYCVKLNNKARSDLISELETHLQVEVPPSPPEQYAAVRWQELREMNKNGLEVGSHK